MPDPEALARIQIDRLMTEASWLVVDRHEANIFAGRCIAIREVSIPGAGEADYLFIADRRAIGTIEAKAAGDHPFRRRTTDESLCRGNTRLRYSLDLPLPMLYKSTGIETRFTTLLEPERRWCKRRTRYLRSRGNTNRVDYGLVDPEGVTSPVDASPTP